jgi:hypothetical protein
MLVSLRFDRCANGVLGHTIARVGDVGMMRWEICTLALLGAGLASAAQVATLGALKLA